MVKVIVGVMMMIWRKMRMTITGVWVVGVVPKPAVVQDKVEGTPIVVSMGQKIFPEKRFPTDCVDNFKECRKQIVWNTSRKCSN